MRSRTRAVVFTMLAALLFTLLPVQKAKADPVTPQILSLQQTGGTDTTIMVSWSVKYASSVEVYIQDESAPEGQKQFIRMATVNTTSYRFTGLVPGNTYDVMIVAVNGENTKLRATRSLYGLKTTISSMGNVYEILWDEDSNSVVVGWDRMSSADGYEYMFENANETAVVDSGSISNSSASLTCTFTVSSRNAYKFSVRAFQNSPKKQYSEWRSIWCIPQPQVKSVVKKGGKLTVKWKKVKGATGYEVYVSNKPKTGYTKVKTLGSKKNSLVVKKVGKKKISKKKNWYVCVMSKRGDNNSGAAYYYDSASKGAVARRLQ